MPDVPYLLTAVVISAAVTWGPRALPFTALAPLRASATAGYLSTRMTAYRSMSRRQPPIS